MTLIEWIEQELINQNETATLLQIFRTGSQLFLKQPNDMDIVFVLDGYKQKRRKVVVEDNGIVWDMLLIDKTYIDKIIDFNDLETYPFKIHSYLFLLRDVIYGDYNLSWDILEHEAAYYAYLKDRYMDNIKTIRISATLGKMFVHYYIPLKWFENQSTEITGEMLQDIQALYSRSEEALPIISWIQNKIDTED